VAVYKRKDRDTWVARLSGPDGRLVQTNFARKTDARSLRRQPRRGEADPIVPVTDAHTVAQALPHATLRAFPGDLHDVLNEHDRDVVHDAVAKFLATVVAGPSMPLAS
jgi:pimeloyl-ACP methyl ester carboxylesterase